LKFRLFFDASALAATATPHKATSYLLMRGGMAGPVEVSCYASEYALRETLRTLANPDKVTPAGMLAGLKFLGTHLTTGSLVCLVGMPDAEERARWEPFIADKDDAPILADARRAGATLIVSYDKKHVLKVDPQVFATATPEAALQAIELAVAGASQASATTQPQTTEGRSSPPSTPTT
jgi:hypothetical protein